MSQKAFDNKAQDPQAPALALWVGAAGRVELREAAAPSPAIGELGVRALVSGISRGTESLVFQGRVPQSEWVRMACPLQEGQFPFPVKYGYAMVGEVTDGPPERLGHRVFCLHPHQSRFTVPAEAALPVPADVTSERAALAPQMETALNATWDAAPRIGDRIAVVGAGVIGLLIAYLCTRIAGTDVTLIDISPARAAVAEALGLSFALAEKQTIAGCDLVFHASGSPKGLELALKLCGFEGQVIELSWFGEGQTPVSLGGAFHSQRLTLRASQVGSVAPERRARWDHRRRLALALSLCADPALDILVQAQTPMADMPGRYGAILADPATLFHLISYPEA